MAKTTRRVLLVMVLLALAISWLAGPGTARAQDSENLQTTEPTDTAASLPSVRTPLSVPTGGTLAIIEIDGAIMYQNQLDSIQRRIDRAVGDGADLIVFELNTPGGALGIALNLSSEILTCPVPTVAWVNDMALSAGILVASACDEIVMARASLTGDCAPIIPGRSLAPTERSKALAPLLAQFRAHAQDNYGGTATNDYALFHAMCVLGVEVYQVRHKITGEVRLVNQYDYAVMVNGVSPIDAADIGGASTSAVTDPVTGEEVDSRPAVSVTDASEAGRWELIKQIHNGSELLTLYEAEARDYGLSRATISTEDELKGLYGAAQVLRYEETWSESMVGFLVHPLVRACLLLLGVGGLLIEYFSPGLFLPGIIGLAAIAVLIGAPFLVGLAHTWHLVLIVIGAGLVIYELFTMTTFGVLAVLGLLMFLAGLVLSGVQTATNGLPAPGSGRQVAITSMSFVGAIILSVPMLFLMVRYFGSLPLLNKLVLNESQSAWNPAKGTTRLPHQHVSGDESVGGGMIKIGVTGTVTSTGLRPAGRIQIGDQLIDVTSTGGFIEPGTEVRVVEVHGNMISVEPIDKA